MAKKDHVGPFVVYALAAIGLATVLLLAGAALAGHTGCAERSIVVAQLKKNYSETVVSIGLGSDGKAIEVFVSSKGGFTIIATDTHGLSCILSSGTDFEPRPAPPDTPS